MGDETFDNLPLVPALIEGAAADTPAIAVGADLRTRGFAFESLPETVDEAAARGAPQLKLLFIECDDERLQQRYTEPRRPHPLAQDRPMVDGIRLERRLVSPLRDSADPVIDTSNLTAAQLERFLARQFALDRGGLRVFVISFSYRQGLPGDADLILDVHFLDNPHYVAELRPLTGFHPWPATSKPIRGSRCFSPASAD